MSWFRCGTFGSVGAIDFDNHDDFEYSSKNSNSYTSHTLTTTKKYKMIILSATTSSGGQSSSGLSWGGGYTFSIPDMTPDFELAKTKDGQDQNFSVHNSNAIKIYQNVPEGTTINITTCRAFVTASCFY